MIALSATVLGIAVAGSLAILRAPQAPAARRRILVVYLLLAGLAAIPLVFAFARSLYTFYLAAALPMLLATPPAVYAYVDQLTRPAQASAPLRRHALFPLAGGLVTVGYWFLPTTLQERMFIDGELPPGPFPAALALATIIFIGAWILASLGYVVAVLRRLRVFRARLKDSYSNVSALELRWFDWLMACLAVYWSAVAAALLSDNTGWGRVVSGEWVLAISAGLLLFILAAAPIKAPAPEADARKPDEPSADPTAGKYERSALSDDLAERLAARVVAAMRDDRLYLDPNLSLQKLARHVAGAPNLVSQTLNERLGWKFYDYVASWRVEAAKPMILAGEQSILAIAMEVGFNSKSTFYKAFKKETGMTPKAYGEAMGAVPGPTKASESEVD